MPTPDPIARHELPRLLSRAIPFLRDEASHYVDDGSNEPLELAREIEAFLASCRNREAREPGGMECERCGSVFIGAEWHSLCGVCIDQGVAQPDGSGLREGGNGAATPPDASPQPQATNPVYTAHPIPADMVLVLREATPEMLAHFWNICTGGDWMCFTPELTKRQLARARKAYRAMLSAAPPLNELLGQPEEFNLNEVSGDSGQLASLEQRAREDELPPGFVWLTASAAHCSDAAANIRQLAEDVGAYDEPAGIVPAPTQARLLADIADALEADALFHRTATLSAQPRVTPEHWIEIGKAQALAEFTEQRAAQRRELLAAPQPREVRASIENVSVNGRHPTHYCNQCGALWLGGENYWSLVSANCGKCCDNEPMTGSNIKALPVWLEWPGMGHILTSATTPQDAAGVVAWMHDDGKDIHIITDKIKRIWQTAKEIHVEHYNIPLCRRVPVLPVKVDHYVKTTTPPGVDVGKLRELAASWQSEAGTAQRDGQHGIYGGMSYCADSLLAAIDDAAPGGGQWIVTARW